MNGYTDEPSVEYPWYDEDKESWVMSYYYESTSSSTVGTALLCDEFGNCDDVVDAADVPSGKEVAKQWNDYHEWVKDKLEDPLNQYMYSRSVDEVWELRLAKHGEYARWDGARIKGSGHRWFAYHELPPHIQDSIRRDSIREEGDLIFAVDGKEDKKWTWDKLSSADSVTESGETYTIATLEMKRKLTEEEQKRELKNLLDSK